MESIKPGFDVRLQTGLHRGLYNRNLYKKRRHQKSKSLHEGIDKAGRRKKERGHSLAEDDALESLQSGFYRHMRPPAEIDKLKAFDNEQDRGDRWITKFRELSPERHHKTLETGDRRVDVGVRSKTKANASPGTSLTAMVMRATRMSTDDDARSTWSTYATLPRAHQHRYYPGPAVISVDELPRPQSGTYLVQETEKIAPVTEDDQTWSIGKAGLHEHEHGHGVRKDDAAEMKYFGNRHTRKSGVHAHSDKLKTHDKDLVDRRMAKFPEILPGSAVISVEEIPRPQKGTYLVHETERIVPATQERGHGVGEDDVAEIRYSGYGQARPSVVYDRDRQMGKFRELSPSTAVISVEEVPRPQRGTYLVHETEQTLTGGDEDQTLRAGDSRTRLQLSTQTNGPQVSVQRPLSISLHGDELMAYLGQTESAPGEFTLDAMLAGQQESKHKQRLQSVGPSTRNLFVDDDVALLQRYLDNPFTGHDYEHTSPKQVRLSATAADSSRFVTTTLRSKQPSCRILTNNDLHLQ